MKEQCNWCSTIWKDTIESHQGLDNHAIALLVKTAMEETYREANCEGKLCLPLEVAKKIAETNPPGSTLPKEKPIKRPREGFFMRRAREVVELKILDEVKGHPDKWTAFASARKCGCNQCVSLYNSWVDMWSQGDPKYDKFKKPLSGQKHVDW